MNDIFSELIKNFESTYTLIEANTLEMIDKIADVNSNIFMQEPLKSFYDKENISVLKLILLSIMFGCILYRFVKMVLSLYDNCDWNFMSQIVIKAVLIIIISTNSDYILKEVINVNFLFTETVESMLKEITNEEICYESLMDQFSNIKEFFKDKYKLDIKDSIKVISCFLIVSLFIIFSVRYVFIILFIILFPFLLGLFLLDKGKNFLYKFFKFFMINLFIQNINKIIIFIPIISKKEELYEIILIGALFILYKINKSVINVGDIWKR